MKKSPLSQKTVLYAGGILLASILLILLSTTVLKPTINEQTETVTLKSVSSEVQASGSIVAQNQATLHFQIPGKLTYLSVKKGDTVKQGQTIASLDTTSLQKQLEASLNTYRSTRDTFDQTVQNQGNSVAQNLQSKATGQSDLGYINDVVKRLVDQNQANLDNSVISVELAQQAINLATLSSPINGVVTAMDVTTSGVNVTPVTGFTISDPSSLVFRANVTASDIPYVYEGMAADINMTGTNTTVIGTVSTIYPDKVTLPTGESVYQVDVTSVNLPDTIKLGETGSVLIKSARTATAYMVPTWLVLHHESIWVLANGKPILRKVTVGKTYSDMTEILSGLRDGDTVITNPKAIAAQKYSVL